jgi:hypothetical protein
LSPDEANDTTDDVQYEGQAILLHGRIKNLEREAAEAKEDDKRYKSAQLAFNRRLVVSNILLVICTAATGAVSLWQATISGTAATAAKDAARAASDNANTAAYALMQNEWTSDFTLEQMAAQTAAQQIAANAAKKTSDDAGGYFRSEQRPYIYSTPVGGFFDDPKQRNGARHIIEPLKDGSYLIAVSVHLINSGRTPAANVVSSQIEYKFGPPEIAFEQTKDFHPNYSHVGEDILAAGDSMDPLSSPMKLTSEQLKHLQDGTWAFTVVGGVIYQDLFLPRMKPYETTYCYLLAPQGLVFHNCGWTGYFGLSIK